MILAWLLLLTGLTISAVAIYYSVVGLTAIFSAAVIPIIVMGSALEIGKLVCASWLKANWERAPRFMRIYMTVAVIVLMLITSMGIFGFLSKAHNDQNLVSGDVTSKIAIYDEKIKTEKENIDANRKALKQLDDAVDQVMGRSSDEKGADKAVAIRKAQQKDRSRLSQEITESQKRISALNDERAPIAAEVRKVEAEVGPIKYIAAFIYGTTPDESMLERAVTWIIILIVIVFDPLAVIMLLASQMTFGWAREQQEEYPTIAELDTFVGEKPTAEEIAEGDSPVRDGEDVVESQPTVTKQPIVEYQILEDVDEEEASQTPVTALGGDITAPEELTADSTDSVSELEKWNKMIEEAEREVAKNRESTVEERLATGQTYIDSNGNETTVEPTFPEPDLATESEGTEFPLDPIKGDLFIRTDYDPKKEFKFDGTHWVGNEEVDESKKKTYMIKDETGQIQIKSR